MEPEPATPPPASPVARVAPDDAPSAPAKSPVAPAAGPSGTSTCPPPAPRSGCSMESPDGSTPATEPDVPGRIASERQAGPRWASQGAESLRLPKLGDAAKGPQASSAHSLLIAGRAGRTQRPSRWASGIRPARVPALEPPADATRDAAPAARQVAASAKEPGAALAASAVWAPDGSADRKPGWASESAAQPEPFVRHARQATDGRAALEPGETSVGRPQEQTPA